MSILAVGHKNDANFLEVLLKLPLVVTNCNGCSRWAGIPIGLLSRGDFENMVITNCAFRDHRDSGLKIQMNEAGQMKNMVFGNLTMVNVLVAYGTVGE